MTEAELELVRGPFEEAVRARRAQVADLRKFSFLRLLIADRARAFTIARITDLSILADFHAAVDQAIETGGSWRDFRDSWNAIRDTHGWGSEANLTDWHARLVYEQNVAMAWSAGRFQQAREAGLGLWRYLPSEAVNPREEHMQFYGKIYALGAGPMPPLDFGCQCGWEPVFEAELSDAERRQLAQEGSFGPPVSELQEFQFHPGAYFEPVTIASGRYPAELVERLREQAEREGLAVRFA